MTFRDLAAIVFPPALALGFGWAALTKIVRPRRWREDLRRYRLRRLERAAALVVVPWAELSVVVLLVAGRGRLASALALALLVAFSLAVVRARVLSGDRMLQCGCFGGGAPRDYRVVLVRNLAFAGLAAAVLVLPAEENWWGAGPGGMGGTLSLLGTLALAAVPWVAWLVVDYRRRRGPGPRQQPVRPR